MRDTTPQAAANARPGWFHHGTALAQHSVVLHGRPYVGDSWAELNASVCWAGPARGWQAVVTWWGTEAGFPGRRYTTLATVDHAESPTEAMEWAERILLDHRPRVVVDSAGVAVRLSAEEFGPVLDPCSAVAS